MPETENTPNTVDDTGEVDMVVTGVGHMNISNQIHDLTNWSRNDVEDATVDAKVIEEARQAPTSEPSFADIVEDDNEDDDTYVTDGVVAPAVDSSHGGGEDDFFCVKFIYCVADELTNCVVNNYESWLCYCFTLAYTVIVVAKHISHKQ